MEMIHHPHKAAAAAAVPVSTKAACGHLKLLAKVMKHLCHHIFQLLALDAELNLALLSMD
jgi:hypothetical protein